MANKKSNTSDKIIKEELNSMYDTLYSLRNFRNKMNKSYDEVLDNNRILRLILKLLATCTIGIYIMIAMFAAYWHYHL